MATRFRTFFEFKEDEHPRDEDGEFSGYGVKSSVTKEISEKINSAIDHVETGSNSQAVFHGTNQQSPVLHVGQTFADNEETADRYSDAKTFSGKVDLGGLKIAHVKPFDRDDANYGAIGDSEKDIQALQEKGIDLLVYDDEDPDNRQHKAYRVVSEKALNRFNESVSLKDKRYKKIAKEAVNWEGFGGDYTEIEKYLEGKTPKEIHDYLLKNTDGDEDVVKDILKESKVKLHSLVSDLSPLVFTRFEAKKDPAHPGFYAGVLIIQKGIAKGHYAVQEGSKVVNFDCTNPDHAELRKYQIVIGDETLDDVERCGVEADSTKCKLDHGATIKDIVGNYGTFRRDGDKVRADLTLMQSAPMRSYVEELFEKFAKKVGNSIDFDYRYEIQGDVAVARCVKLNSVDLVDAPAATNSLFNENPTPTNPAHMPLDTKDLEAIGTLIDGKLSAVKTDLNSQLTALSKKMEEGDDDADEEKKKKDAEDKKKEDDDKAAMSAGHIEKAVMAGIQKLLPKATVDNLNSLAARGGDKDEYAEKVTLCEAAGITGPQVARYIAAKFPAIYNAKFGNGGGQKGSAKATV